MTDAAIPPALSGSDDATGKVKKKEKKVLKIARPNYNDIYGYTAYLAFFIRYQTVDTFFLLLTNFKSISYVFIHIIHHCTSGSHLFGSISVCYEHELDMNMRRLSI